MFITLLGWAKAERSVGTGISTGPLFFFLLKFLSTCTRVQKQSRSYFRARVLGIASCPPAGTTSC